MFSTFYELEIRFGAVAYHYLQEIEKAARIASNPLLDPETRLARAVNALDSERMRGAA